MNQKPETKEQPPPAARSLPHLTTSMALVVVRRLERVYEQPLEPLGQSTHKDPLQPKGFPTNGSN